MNTKYKTLSSITVIGLLSACGGSDGDGGASNSTPASNSNQLSEFISTSSGEANEANIPNNDNIIEGIQHELLSIGDSFEPDSALLNSFAETSSSLYVDHDFNFEAVKNLNIDISAVDDAGNPLNDKLIKIKALPTNITSWDDPGLSEAQLIYIARTDINGELKKTIEVIDSLERLLVEINVIGIENKTILELGATNPQRANHMFQ